MSDILKYLNKTKININIAWIDKGEIKHDCNAESVRPNGKHGYVIPNWGSTEAGF